MSEESADVYTDGSCHTQQRIGVWVAIIFTTEEKKIISDTVVDTTHNRMELLAVIKAIEFIKSNHPFIATIRLFSDSQYVVGLPGRKEKLAAAEFLTKKGSSIQNADLVKELFELLSSITVNFIKVKAHQKRDETANYNIEADKLSRKMVRDRVKK